MIGTHGGARGWNSAVVGRTPEPVSEAPGVRRVGRQGQKRGCGEERTSAFPQPRTVRNPPCQRPLNDTTCRAVSDTRQTDKCPSGATDVVRFAQPGEPAEGRGTRDRRAELPGLLKLISREAPRLLHYLAPHHPI
jgi:hypothetical protein